MTSEQRALVEAFLRECIDVCDAPAGNCKRCGVVLAFDGQSPRSVSKIVLGEVLHINDVAQRRLRCKQCGGRWLRVAPGVVRRVHFQACVHASVVVDLAQGASTSEVARSHACDRHTVRRLVARAAAVGDAHEVARELLTVIDEPVLPAARVVERAVPLGDATARNLAAALMLLVAVEALGNARGEEPPAFGPFMRARMTSSSPTMPSEIPRCRDPPSADGRRAHSPR